MRIPGAGVLRYHLFTRPFDRWERWMSQRRLPELLKLADSIPPFPQPGKRETSEVYPAYFLTGKRFLHLTLFSAASLVRCSGIPWKLHIISDGTLGLEERDRLEEVFPGRVRIDSESEQLERIESLFPIDRFPILRKTRATANLFRKLMDVHGGETGSRLYVDSDTFFWRRPVQLEKELIAGRLNLYSPDHYSNYGNDVGLLSDILGQPVLPRVCAGLTLMRSEQIDWDRLEHWLMAIQTLPGGKPDFWEQGLTAMHLTLAGAQRLPPEDFVLTPRLSEVRSPRGVLHHYAGGSKHRFTRMLVPRVLWKQSR